MSTPQSTSHHYLQTIKRLCCIIAQHHKLKLIAVIIATLASALADVLGNLLLQSIFDDYIVPLIGQQHPNLTAFAHMLSLMALIYIVGIVASYLFNQWMVEVSQGSLKHIRDRMFAHMQQLPLAFFDTHTHGELMSYYTNDTDTLEQVISQSFPQILASITRGLFAFCAMCYMNYRLTIVIVLMTLCVLWVSKLIAKRSAKYFTLQQRSLASINGYVEEMMNGQKVIKVFCHETEAQQAFQQLNTELYNNTNKANKYANILMPIMMNLGNLQYCLIATLAGVMLVTNIGQLTIGGIVTFLQLAKNLSISISHMSQQFNFLMVALVGAERIFSMLDQSIENNAGSTTLVNAQRLADGSLQECEQYTGLWAWKCPQTEADTAVTLPQSASATAQTTTQPHATSSIDSYVANTAPQSQQSAAVTQLSLNVAVTQPTHYYYHTLKGQVTCRHMSFGYQPGKLALKDINFTAEPGQKIAFVGHTGAGKTTITNLVNRFYEISQGELCIDGINIQNINKASLRRSLGMVLQDTNLFSGTIMDNIRYGKLTATAEEIYTAAQLANADQFIQRLPNQYQTLISDNGEELSQGQKQLLSIARAALANPPILILDEATSSIDTRTEKIVQQGMDSLMQGRTVLVIAHRLSTIRNADLIIVLDHGQIIEQGQHAELLAQEGMYYQLYTGKLELD